MKPAAKASNWGERLRDHDKPQPMIQWTRFTASPLKSTRNAKIGCWGEKLRDHDKGKPQPIHRDTPPPSSEAVKSRATSKWSERLRNPDKAGLSSSDKSSLEHIEPRDDGQQERR